MKALLIIEATCKRLYCHKKFNIEMEWNGDDNEEEQTN